MKRSTIVALAALAFFAVPNLTSAMPTIYPRGTTIYDPEKCWNGYTVISMNGNNKEMDSFWYASEHHSHDCRQHPDS